MVGVSTDLLSECFLNEILSIYCYTNMLPTFRKDIFNYFCSILVAYFLFDVKMGVRNSSEISVYVNLCQTEQYHIQKTNIIEI
jgi:hypothetical protein